MLHLFIPPHLVSVVHLRYDKSQKYDVFKSKIEKFKIPRHPVSYEVDPESVLKTVPKENEKNDSVIEDMIPKFDPAFNYKDKIESSAKIELQNNDPIESNFARVLTA